MRSLSILSWMLPFLTIQVFFRRIEASELGVYGVFLTSAISFYDSARESRWALGIFIAYTSLALVFQHVLRPILAIGEESIVLHLPLMQFGWKFLFTAWSILILVLLNRKERLLNTLMVQERDLRVSQEKAMKDLEQARAEAEARYAEARRFQAELAREVARTTLTARYEALMRDQYGNSLPDFLRALLESLQDDLGFVAGLAYQVKDGAYEVVATYALPQYQGRVFSGGLLETATALKKTYLVAIPPRTLPLKTLATLKPQYALYLPISVEIAQGQVVAVIELLFLSKPDSEKIPILDALLPRIGTYIWMQLKSLNHV